MTIRTEGYEYNILGSTVRLKLDGEDSANALRAVEILQKEIQTIQTSNSKLKEMDIAILAALKLASKLAALEVEYKETVTSLRSGVTDALNFIEEVSPGPALRN